MRVNPVGLTTIKPLGNPLATFLVKRPGGLVAVVDSRGRVIFADRPVRTMKALAALGYSVGADGALTPAKG